MYSPCLGFFPLHHTSFFFDFCRQLFFGEWCWQVSTIWIEVAGDHREKWLKIGCSRTKMGVLGEELRLRRTEREIRSWKSLRFESAPHRTCVASPRSKVSHTCASKIFQKKQNIPWGLLEQTKSEPKTLLKLNLNTCWSGPCCFFSGRQQRFIVCFDTTYLSCVLWQQLGDKLLAPKTFHSQRDGLAGENGTDEHDEHPPRA